MKQPLNYNNIYEHFETNIYVESFTKTNFTTTI